MDGESSDSSFYERARSLGWKTRDISTSSAHSSRLSTSRHGSVEKKQGESRRTTKRLQEAKEGVGGFAHTAPTTDITALMDNYFFFNAAHAAAASRGLGGGVFSRQKQHGGSEYDENGADDINLYGDNEELRSRFVRTLEWVDEASKVVSPSSPLSKESYSSRSVRVPVNNNADLQATNSLEIVSVNNEYSGDRVREVTKSLDAFIARDKFEGASFRLPPSAISRGEVNATSFRVPQKPPPRVTNNHSMDHGDLNIPSYRPKQGDPDTACELPYQSLGNRPVKDFKGDGIQGYNDHGHENYGYLNADKLYSKPNYAMGLYDRNDRLARSAYHPNLERRAPPKVNENPSRAQKAATTNDKEAKKDGTSKDAQQQKQKTVKGTDKALKEAPANKASPGAKVQQWFSKLIGKSSKPENVKASKTSNKVPFKANSEQATEKSLLTSDYELVIHKATMHDVLTKKANVAVYNQASKTRFEETQLPFEHKPPQAPQLPPTLQRASTDPDTIFAANPASKTSAFAPLTAHHEEPRGPSRRFVDNARSQRFGYGSISERWVPQHAKHDQPRQAKEYYQEDKQRIMQASVTYDTIKSARLSPSKADQQLQNFVRPPMASANPRMSGKESTATIVNHEIINQKHSMDEVERRDLRSRHNQENGLEAMPHVVSKVTQEAIPNRSQAIQMDAKQYAKEINSMNDRQNISLGAMEYKSRAFVASYASRSERFSQRSRVQRDNESARKSMDIRGGPEDAFTKKGTHPMTGGSLQGNELTARTPPPDEDRDIEVLNNFLIQKKANLHVYSHETRLHFILSNSSISSMVAALCYAWTLHNSKANKQDGWERVPVMSVTRNNMWNYKQLAWLFEQAGLDTQAVIFIDEVDLDAISDVVGEYRLSTIGQDIVRLRGELASYCTLVAEEFFKQVDSSRQAKCIRILLLAGLLIDTENLDSTSVRYTRRDEMAASSLLPGAGHKGRAVLLAELKQGNTSKDFCNIMCKNYGEEPSGGGHPNQKIVKSNGIGTNGKSQVVKEADEDYRMDFFSEDTSSVERSKSSKSFTSLSTTSVEQGKSRSSSISPPLTH